MGRVPLGSRRRVNWPAELGVGASPLVGTTGQLADRLEAPSNGSTGRPGFAAVGQLADRLIRGPRATRAPRATGQLAGSGGISGVGSTSPRGFAAGPRLGLPAGATKYSLDRSTPGWIGFPLQVNWPTVSRSTGRGPCPRAASGGQLALSPTSTPGPTSPRIPSGSCPRRPGPTSPRIPSRPARVPTAPVN